MRARVRIHPQPGSTIAWVCSLGKVLGSDPCCMLVFFLAECFRLSESFTVAILLSIKSLAIFEEFL